VYAHTLDDIAGFADMVQTTAVAKIRKAHSKRIGTETLLVDGTEVAKDDAKIQSLDHFGSELVVFWSVVDDGRVPLKEASARQRNVRRGELVKPMPVKPEPVELDLKPVKLEQAETKLAALSTDIPPIVSSFRSAIIFCAFF
jgi:hypothetical protein